MELKLQVSSEAIEQLEANEVTYYIKETREAAEIYNRLAQDNQDVAGLFHTTC